MAGQVVVLEDAQPCRSGQALRPDWQCGRGAGWGAQACQPQTGDLDLHCLAQDVHPLLGRPASPRLPGPVHLRVSIEWRWWRSWWCWWKPSLHRSADNRRHRHTARKKWANTNNRTSDHVHVLHCGNCARTSQEGVLLFARICFIFRGMARQGVVGVQQGQGDCKLQLTGKQNMAQLRSVSLANTQHSKTHKQQQQQQQQLTKFHRHTSRTVDTFLQKHTKPGICIHSLHSLQPANCEQMDLIR